MARNPKRLQQPGKRLEQDPVPVWKRILILAVVLIFLMAAGLTALAEYTRASRARRVVGAYEPTGSLFSSNYLLPGESARNHRTIFVGGAVDPTAVITVCNYAQGNPGKYYDNDITYTFTWRLVTVSSSTVGGVTTYTVTPYAGSEYTVGVSKGGSPLAAGTAHTFTLTGGVRGQDVFHLTLDRAMMEPRTDGEDNPLPPVYAEILVVPTENYIDIPANLTGLFDVAERSALAEVSWAGSFSDDRTGMDPADYDGFNYIITGSGAGTVTLSWDSSKLVLSEAARQMELGGAAVTTSGTAKSLTLSVDSGVVDQYQVQFYRAPGNDETMTWAAMEGTGGAGGYVTVAFTPAE